MQVTFYEGMANFIEGNDGFSFFLSFSSRRLPGFVFFLIFFFLYSISISVILSLNQGVRVSLVLRWGVFSCWVVY